MKTKKIHSTWKTADTSRFPAHWQQSWKDLNPSWEYCFWTDDDIEAFVKEEYPDFYETWIDYDKPIKRPDTWRYLALQRIGGIYVDMDFACLKPIDSLLENVGSKFAIGREGDPNAPHTFGNSLMACDPNPSFLEGITEAFRKKRHLHVLESSACGFITKRIKGREKEIFELDTNHVFPVWWAHERKHEFAKMSIEELQKEFPNSYAATFFTGTWLDQ